MLLVADPAFAREMRIMGGSGGAEYTMRCKAGSYMTGIHGRAGDWFDAIGPICKSLPTNFARANRLFLVGPVFVAPKGGWNGRTVNSPCSGDDRAVKSIAFNLTEPGGGRGRYVDNIEAVCAKIDIRMDNPTVITIPTNDDLTGGLATAAEKYFYKPVSGFRGGGVPLFSQSCPNKELAVGIRVRAGHYVDGIGLICGAAPTPPAAYKKIGRAIPTTKKIGRALPSAPKPVIEKLNVNCTSAGQLCNRHARFALPSGAPNGWLLVLRAPAGHCSHVKYYVRGGGNFEYGRTAFLAPGQAGTVQVPDVQTVQIGAQGRLGGCNQGRLGGWSIEVTARAN